MCYISSEMQTNTDLNENVFTRVRICVERVCVCVCVCVTCVRACVRACVCVQRACECEHKGECELLRASMKVLSKNETNGMRRSHRQHASHSYAQCSASMAILLMEGKKEHNARDPQTRRLIGSMHHTTIHNYTQEQQVDAGNSNICNHVAV
jgi:hypothetical protein